jgi:hypothetical protein
MKRAEDLKSAIIGGSSSSKDNLPKSTGGGALTQSKNTGDNCN